ncbi:MBL fold metallo-hydrolase [Phytohabitans kaempferiae]|uniref:MBL fold metallo-hydrolase n=1 Tax=Phytohabitans kaempferiae TaxID=1620943 RepID=A0ABV6MGC7_9ACTN
MTYPACAQRAAWAQKRLPEVEAVCDGVWSIPVPLPNEALRYVLAYAVVDGPGVVVIDPGWNTDEAWRALVDGLAVAGHQLEAVSAVLVTHLHPDHYGLAHRLREASGAPVALHPADAAMLMSLGGANDAFAARNEALLRQMGVGRAERTEMLAAWRERQSRARPLPPDRLVVDGETLPGGLRAVWTPGHSPGHLCFVDDRRGILFAGDHVLPHISPNISVHPHQRASPLTDYLTSLSVLPTWDVVQVLPAHEYRFEDLAGRVSEIVAHHEGRLRQILSVLASAPGATCDEVAAELTWSRPWRTFTGAPKRAALGETLAHLVHLEQAGQTVYVGEDRQRWYRAADLLTGSSQPSVPRAEALHRPPI